MSFAHPWVFFLLIIIPLLVLWYYYRHHKLNSNIQFFSTSFLGSLKPTWKQRMMHLPFILRLLSIIFIIIALARPQSSTSRQETNVEGIDIVTALDISTSMLAEDFQPNRLEASKKLAQEFIDGRPNDRIGLVVFAGEAFTQCPLTTDHGVISGLFEDIKCGMIEDGTAIGDGLATAVNRLSTSQAVSKVIILVTDGVNNRGNIDPGSAAEIAKKYGIHVYTIGVGTQGFAPYPVKTPFGIQYQNMEVNIDEDLLKQISSVTDGKYFRATSNNKLQQIYKEIDQMEKSRIDVTEFRNKNEEFFIYALIALLFLFVEFILSRTVLRTLP
ncbi:MAG: VWA domain-containing protein [Bacteroidales bacterium]|nr:VWA domain-containing protein [Bacteroidales bacterium]